VTQLDAQRKYNGGNTYRPEDLNPYKRARARTENRTAGIKRLTHKGTLLSEQPKLPFSDEQVQSCARACLTSTRATSTAKDS
jgi:hypothetical protein